MAAHLTCSLGPVYCLGRAFQVVLVVKNPPASAGDIRDAGLIPGPGRSPREGHSNPLQYSCLENPMDRGAWQATVHGVTKSQPWLSHWAYCLENISLGLILNSDWVICSGAVVWTEENQLRGVVLERTCCVRGYCCCPAPSQAQVLLSSPDPCMPQGIWCVWGRSAGQLWTVQNNLLRDQYSAADETDHGKIKGSGWKVGERLALSA